MQPFFYNAVIFRRKGTGSVRMEDTEGMDDDDEEVAVPWA